MQQCGVLPLADKAAEPAAVQVTPRNGTLHTLQRPGADCQ
jgi:hypothetical protein